MRRNRVFDFDKPRLVRSCMLFILRHYVDQAVYGVTSCEIKVKFIPTDLITEGQYDPLYRSISTHLKT